jgi:uroporphyrinogen decarboxylase
LAPLIGYRGGMSAARTPFSHPVKPDWEAFISCIRRRGTPRRVHCAELFLDAEVQDAVCARYELAAGLDPADPFYPEKRQIALQRFLGYDYVRCGLENVAWTFNETRAEDTASNRRADGRAYMDEHRGPITSWEELEAYPWPDFSRAGTRSLEWYQKNLPDDMCLVSGGNSHYAELLQWLMGYETLCYTLFDQPDLVRAIRSRVDELSAQELSVYLQFDRVRCIWGSDDMGFRSGLLLSPADMRELVLSGHRLMAEKTHASGRLYLLHSCGDLSAIREDLISTVQIDAKHSFEDTIESVIDAKRGYGERVALLGGIDVDFLCRSTPDEIRARVRKTVEACQPGGGWCLGTGNTVANYIPLDNYLAMLDAGRIP